MGADFDMTGWISSFAEKQRQKEESSSLSISKDGPSSPRSMVTGGGGAIANGGKITMVRDLQLQANCADIDGGREDILNTFVQFPAPQQYIGVHLPILVLHLKNLSKYVAIEVEVQTSTGQVKTIRTGNNMSVVRLTPESAKLPLTLVEGWNKIVLDLGFLTERIFNSNYEYCNRVKVYSNCRLRRVYFSDRIYKNDELPVELRSSQNLNATAQI
jgi:hypothetical protein